MSEDHHPEREMPYFGQELFEMAQEKGPLSEREYLDVPASNHRLSRAEGIDAVTVRAGHVHGVPVGISFIGRAWSEPTLIRIAYAYEQATRHRTPPRFLPSLELSGP